MEATLWVAGSVLLYVLAAYVLWGLSHAGGKVGSAWRRWQRWPGSVVFSELVRAAYYLGVPYAAVVVGAADYPAFLGLSTLDWQASVARGTIAGIGLFLALAGIAWYSFRGLRAPRVDAGMPSSRSWLSILYEAALLQAHWAFYRLPGILITGDFFLGTSIGAGLALMEMAADPEWRERATASQTGLEAWQRLALLVGMTVVFYVTRNLFVAWGVHALVEKGSQWASQRFGLRLPDETAAAAEVEATE